MRRFFTILVAMVLCALPFACEEDFAGGGGLPGDVPRASNDAGGADGARDRADPSDVDARVEDATADAEDAD